MRFRGVALQPRVILLLLTAGVIVPSIAAAQSDPAAPPGRIEIGLHVAWLRQNDLDTMPAGLGDRTVTLRVRQDAAGGRRIGDVVAKRVRGQAARHLLESGTDVDDPDGIAGVLAERWPVELAPPARPGRPWTMTLSTVD